jgi:uncharacterized protein (TIGR01244 family)
MKNVPIPSLRRLSGEIWISGQPDAGQLAAARDAGLRTVVSLCPAGECGWDEKSVAGSLGLEYATVPVGAACDLTPAAAHQLHELLESCAKPVLVHCGSGNRVGALFALKAFHVHGHAPEDALAHGRAAGLTGLENAVRALLTSSGETS